MRTLMTHKPPAHLMVFWQRETSPSRQDDNKTGILEGSPFSPEVSGPPPCTKKEFKRLSSEESVEIVHCQIVSFCAILALLRHVFTCTFRPFKCTCVRKPVLLYIFISFYCN